MDIPISGHCDERFSAVRDAFASTAFGHVMNHVNPSWPSTRNRALIDAVYASP